MELSDLITITITKNTRTVAKAGFGVALILSATAAWVERTRTYANMTAVAADFAATTPEYLAAQKYFSQDPHPPQVIIGRGNDAAPTQDFLFTPNVFNNYTYSFTVLMADGEHVVTYTSDGTATATEITTGLKAAFDLLSVPGFTSSIINTNTTLRVLANAAGSWLGIRCTDDNMGFSQNQSDPTSSAALDLIKLENNTWYGLVTLFNSSTIVQAVAQWAEANKKLYIAATADNQVRSHVLSGAGDVAYQIKNSGYTHTSIWFCTANYKFLDAALLGAVLPLDPGSETWAFKALAGVPADEYTETQLTNIKAKNANFYTTTAGLNITFEGKVGDGEYIDVIRLIDFMEARLAEEIFGVLANARKVPFDDKGINTIGGAIRRVLKQIANPPYSGIEPDFTISLPAAADISPSDKAARTLNGINAGCVLTGAIHYANLEVNVSV